MPDEFDIYAYAETHDEDYLDEETGCIFKVQEYNRCRRNGWPTKGIEIHDFRGNSVGFASK